MDTQLDFDLFEANLDAKTAADGLMWAEITLKFTDQAINHAPGLTLHVPLRRRADATLLQLDAEARDYAQVLLRRCLRALEEEDLQSLRDRSAQLMAAALRFDTPEDREAD